MQASKQIQETVYKAANLGIETLTPEQKEYISYMETRG